MGKPVVCLMGPTACGKSSLAMQLAQQTPCEIVSVDSALVYKGMDIGTAKPTQQELLGTPHRLINLIDPSEAYSAGQFCVDAMREIDDIHARGKIPLLVGGTMLYFWVLQTGFADLPSANESLRKRILGEATDKGWPLMHAKLAMLDPECAAKINPNDQQRIQRALEVIQLSGKKMSEVQASTVMPDKNYRFHNWVLTLDRSIIHQRIAQRFDLMLQQGLVDEVKTLYDERGDLTIDLPAIRMVGYRQVWSYLAGEYDAETMRNKAIVATRQLAKRQFTWLKRFSGAECFDAQDENLVQKLCQSILQLLP